MSELIVALDYNLRQHSSEPIERLVDDLDDMVNIYKIGPQLLYSGDHGVKLAKHLMTLNKKIFLDIKLWDTPDTMLKTIKAISDEGYSFVTVHCNSRQTLRSLMDVKAPSLKILVVTILTSEDYPSLSIEVLMKSIRARESGADGVITSVHEANAIRKATSSEFLIATPGIRLVNDGRYDQKRTGTPEQAVKAGVDYIIVGRSITKADNPREATIKILDDMRQV